jgi:hypothetical protein
MSDVRKDNLGPKEKRIKASLPSNTECSAKLSFKTRLRKRSSNSGDLIKIIVKNEEGLPGAYNPSYSGGRDQDNRGSEPAQGSTLQDPISKIHITKKRLVEWLKVQTLSSNSNTAKKKKKKKKRFF